MSSTPEAINILDQLNIYELFGYPSCIFSTLNILPPHTIIELQTSGRIYKNGRLPKIKEVRIAMLRDINLLLEEEGLGSEIGENIHESYYFIEMRKEDNNNYSINFRDFAQPIALYRDLVPYQERYFDLHGCLDGYAKRTILMKSRIRLHIDQGRVTVTTISDNGEVHPNNNLVVYQSHYHDTAYTVGDSPSSIQVIQRPERD